MGRCSGRNSSTAPLHVHTGKAPAVTDAAIIAVTVAAVVGAKVDGRSLGE